MYVSMGCPSNGYIFEMRKASRKIYHTQIKYIRENNVKKKQNAHSFIISDKCNF